jgi:hypothetical protein
MKPAQSFGPDYDVRIRRAQYLAGLNPFAAEVLSLYQQVAGFQKNLYAKIAGSPGSAPSGGAGLRLPSELNLRLLLPHFPELLALLEHAGPSPVAQAARELSTQERVEWSALLNDFWTFGGRTGDVEGEAPGESEKPLTEFILRAFLSRTRSFWLCASRHRNWKRPTASVRGAARRHWSACFIWRGMEGSAA